MKLTANATEIKGGKYEITVMADGKVMDVRRTTRKFLSIVAYVENESTESMVVFHCGRSDLAEKHSWWLNGHSYVKNIIPIEYAD